MKLIDLLVQELPERGGWPDDVKVITQDDDGGLCLWKLPDVLVKNGYWRHPTGQGLHQFWSSFPHAEDKAISIVCKEYYEAKLHSVDEVIYWDGEGLPPVGIVCEREGPNGWLQCKINYVSDKIIVYKMLATGNEHGSGTSAFKFRPIRTEEERQREETINTLAEIVSGHMTTEDVALARQIYKAIEKGQVSGVKLGD